MTRKLLIGTRNKHKLDRFKALLSSLNLELHSLSDFNVDIVPDEDGLKPAENALKKARFYFSLTKVPTLSIDYGLYIDKFPRKKLTPTNIKAKPNLPKK